MTPPYKVLLIAGCGRSGSTILASLLGQLEDIVSIGELTNLWAGILRNGTCGCARPFPACPFWSRVLEPDLLDPRRVRDVSLARQGLLERPILRRLGLWNGNRRALDAAADRYAPALGEIYRRVLRVSGSKVIIDSSKQPAHAYAVGRLPECETYVLHVVRDSRAVACSMRRHEGHSTASSARYWMAVNLKTEYLRRVQATRARYLRLRYEDFAESPRTTVKEILRFLGEERSLDIFADDSTVHMSREIHHGEGYPERFKSGPVKIRLDDRWTHTMPRGDRLATLALTWPLLLRYGYSRA